MITQKIGQLERCGFPLSPEQVFALIFQSPCWMETVFHPAFHRSGENAKFSTFFLSGDKFFHGRDLSFSTFHSISRRFFTAFHRGFPIFLRVFNMSGK